MGARTTDTEEGYASDVGTPAILMAQEIMEPVIPQTPSGPTYATPPDWYYKSTYTFNTIFTAVPFQIVYYRADRNSILKILPKLYEGSVLETAENKLRETDEWATDRWRNFVSLDYEDEDGLFSPFPPESTDENDRLPQPNKAPFDGGVFDTDKEKKLAEILYTAFTPLTPKPLLYETDIQANQTISPHAPAIKVSSGDASPIEVRFTDFTLDGGMITSYFYGVRTLNNVMRMSEPSGIIGPIQLINTQPPESPVVRKVTTQIADYANGVETAVRFEISSYPAYEHIQKIDIYRTLDAARALSVRTMERCKTIDLAGKSTGKRRH